MFSPTSRVAPVDGHVFSPTFFCGWTRVFTHRRHVFLPTKLPKKPSNDAGLQNRNARAQSLTLKVFNTLHPPPLWKTPPGSLTQRTASPLGGYAPAGSSAFGGPTHPASPRGRAPRPSASPQLSSPHAYGAGTSRRLRGLSAPRLRGLPPPCPPSLRSVATSPPGGLAAPHRLRRRLPPATNP